MRPSTTMASSTRKLGAGILLFFTLLGAALHCSAETDKNDVHFSQAELDQLLAPIALYPDTVLSQVLIASTYPIEIVQADRWASTHKETKGADAVQLVDNKDWDPSVKALIAFPDILQRMSDDIDWTQRLGDAFLSDEERVMDTVQSLRKKAYSSGSLSKVQHLKIERDDDEIVIEPAEERVVYVPVYDTRVVYGNWWWPDYPPVYWHYPASYTYVSGFYWGPSIYIGPTFFYSSCRWSERRVVVVDRYRHYPNQPHFYTSRSIVTFQGARDWHHDPIHRRGVAYYNDNLRNNYGSRHESYQEARVYREHHRDNELPNRFRGNNDDGVKNNPRVIQSSGRPVQNIEGSGINRQPFDRAEQLRVHMNQHQDGANNIAGESPHLQGAPGANDNGRQVDRSQPNADPRTHLYRRNERESSPRTEPGVNSQPDNQPRISRPAGGERPQLQQDRQQVIERSPNNQADTNRAMRIDDRMTRRVDNAGTEPRAERSHDNGRGMRVRSNDDKND